MIPTKSLTIPLWFLALLCLITKIASGAYCSAQSSQANCVAQSQCAYNASTLVCGCGLNFKQDIIFVVDGTTALSTADFGKVKLFLNKTVQNAMPWLSSTTRVGLYQFRASSSSPSYVVHQRLNASTTQSHTLKIIKQMTSQQADSSKTDAATVLGIVKNDFTRNSVSSQRRVLVIITAGPSTFEVCNQFPRESEIFTYVITIGSTWTTEKYGCLVSQRDQGNSFIQVSSASTLLSSTSTLNKLEDLMCPTKAVVKITEIKPVRTTAGPVRFVELKNYGYDITLSSKPLRLQGFWSGKINVTSTVWKQGQYLVVYNGNDGSPDCSKCSCTNFGHTTNMCSTALYVGCCASCTVDASATKQANCGTFLPTGQTNWTLTAAVSGVTVDSAAYASDWPKVTKGSSFELVSPLFTSAWGSSWAMSCNASGTPGYLHTPCSCSSVTTCNLTSGGLGCTSGKCNCAAGYFPNEQTCDKFPSSSTCTALIKGSTTVDYSWTLATWDRRHQYKLKYCATPTTCDSTVTAYGVAKTQSGVVYSKKPGWISLTWQNNTNYQSTYTNCTLTTMPPTTFPTKAPTYQTPSIPHCNYTVSQDRSQYTAKWGYPVGADMASLQTPDGYRLYHNGNVKGTFTTLYATISSNNMNVTNTIVQVDAYWTRQITYTTAKKTCTGFTLAPTKSPTKKPTAKPTKKPTKRPSVPPTKAPTYRKLNTSHCTVAYTSGQGKSVYISYTTPIYKSPQTVTANVTLFELSYFCNATKLDSWSATLSQPVLRSLTLWYDSQIHSACLRPLWIEDNTNIVYGDFVPCNVTTASPTISPTSVPTESPTRNPTRTPSKAPTKPPTHSPTHSPTFIPIETDWCRFELQSGNKYGSGFFDLIEVDYPNTPNADKIEYYFTFFTNSTNTTKKLPLSGIAQSSLHCVNSSEIAPCETMYTIKTSLSPPFSPKKDKVYLTTTFADTYDTKGAIKKTITCQVETAAPTAAPTTSPSLAPTSAPTFGEVNAYFDALMCDDSNSNASDNTITRQNERCGCKSWTMDCGLSIPIIYAPEQSSNTSITVKRNKATYIYDLRITFELGFVNMSFANQHQFNTTLETYNRRFYGTNSNQSIQVTFPPDSWFTPQHENYTKPGEMGPSRSDIKPWKGEFIVQGSGSRSGNLYLEIFNENPPKGLLAYSTDLPTEVFLLTLTSCNVVNNQNLSGAQDNDIRACSLVYPHRVFLIVEDTDQRTIESNLTTANKSYQGWLWYVLGAIACVLAIAGFMAYRWWVNNKMKQAEVKQADEDIDAVIQEQEEGFGKDLDQVAVNPLAQPYTHLQGPKTNDFNTDDTGADDGGMTDKAEVRTEKIKFKQEFGPTQANKKN